MEGILVDIDGRSAIIPQRYDDLTVQQIACYVKEIVLKRHQLFNQEKDGTVTVKNEMLYRQAQLKLLFHLLPVTWADYRKLDSSWKCYLIDELKVLDFLLNDTVTTIPVQAVKYKYGKKLYGPDNSSKLCAEEFSFADKAYQAFFHSGKQDVLNIFFASIFREVDTWWFIRKHLPATTGDRRQPFNKHLLDQRTKKVMHVSYDTKLAVWYWYHCFRIDLPKKYPHVFTGSNEKNANTGGWLDVILSLSADGPFGDYDKTRHTQINLVLTDMNRRAAIIQRSND